MLRSVLISVLAMGGSAVFGQSSVIENMIAKAKSEVFSYKEPATCLDCPDGKAPMANAIEGISKITFKLTFGNKFDVPSEFRQKKNGDETDSTADRFGIDGDAIRAWIEFRLRKAGLNVVKHDPNNLSTPDMGCVIMQSVEGGSIHHVVCCIVMEWVILQRQEQWIVRHLTWRTRPKHVRIGGKDGKMISQTDVKVAIDKILDLFERDFQGRRYKAEESK